MISWKRSRARSALSSPRSLGISTETETSSGAVDAGQHLVGVGQLGDDVGAHEARRLDAPQAGAHERVDEPHLVVGRDDLGLVLEAVARADLADAHALWKVWHRTLNIYSPPLSEPIAIIGATGALGFGLALRWGRAGVPVVLGSRDAGRAAEAAERARAALPDGHFEGYENAEAAAKAEVVVLCVPVPQPVRDADQPQGRAARAPARRRRHRPAGRRRLRPRDAHARRLAGLGRPAGPGDGPRRRARGQRAAHRQRRDVRRPRPRARRGRPRVRRPPRGQGARHRRSSTASRACAASTPGAWRWRASPSRSPPLLISINVRHKTHAGIKITGV